MALILDTGALIAIDKADRRVIALLVRARSRGDVFVVPAGVVAQAWRDGRKQSRLARFLGSTGVQIEPLDDLCARIAGQVCGVVGTSDIVDASVIVVARRARGKVVTSDPKDLARLGPATQLIVI